MMLFDRPVWLRWRWWRTDYAAAHSRRGLTNLAEMRARQGWMQREKGGGGRWSQKSTAHRERENNARGACVLGLANENRPGETRALCVQGITSPDRSGNWVERRRRGDSDRGRIGRARKKFRDRSDVLGRVVRYRCASLESFTIRAVRYSCLRWDYGERIRVGINIRIHVRSGYRNFLRGKNDILFGLLTCLISCEGRWKYQNFRATYTVVHKYEDK